LNDSLSFIEEDKEYLYAVDIAGKEQYDEVVKAYIEFAETLIEQKLLKDKRDMVPERPILLEEEEKKEPKRLKYKHSNNREASDYT
jgi:hypothetical protein